MEAAGFGIAAEIIEYSWVLQKNAMGNSDVVPRTTLQLNGNLSETVGKNKKVQTAFWLSAPSGQAVVST